MKELVVKFPVIIKTMTGTQGIMYRLLKTENL